jgi:hypothetical protein
MQSNTQTIYTYWIQFWITASLSNIENLEPFQPKDLRMIEDPPCYVLNTVIRRLSRYQRLKYKSSATALQAMLALVHAQRTSSKPHGTIR